MLCENASHWSLSLYSVAEVQSALCLAGNFIPSQIAYIHGSLDRVTTRMVLDLSMAVYYFCCCSVVFFFFLSIPYYLSNSSFIRNAYYIICVRIISTSLVFSMVLRRLNLARSTKDRTNHSSHTGWTNYIIYFVSKMKTLTVQLRISIQESQIYNICS